MTNWRVGNSSDHTFLDYVTAEGCAIYLLSNPRATLQRVYDTPWCPLIAFLFIFIWDSGKNNVAYEDDHWFQRQLLRHHFIRSHHYKNWFHLSNHFTRHDMLSLEISWFFWNLSASFGVLMPDKLQQCRVLDAISPHLIQWPELSNSYRVVKISKS